MKTETHSHSNSNVTRDHLGKLLMFEYEPLMQHLVHSMKLCAYARKNSFTQDCKLLPIDIALCYVLLRNSINRVQPSVCLL